MGWSNSKLCCFILLSYVFFVVYFFENKLHLVYNILTIKKNSLMDYLWIKPMEQIHFSPYLSHFNHFHNLENF